MAKRLTDYYKTVPLEEFDSAKRDELIEVRQGKKPLTEEHRELFKKVVLPVRTMRFGGENRVPVDVPYDSGDDYGSECGGGGGGGGSEDYYDEM